MTRTMKAAVVRAFKEPLVIQEVPVPAPGAGQILVKAMDAKLAMGDKIRQMEL